MKPAAAIVESVVDIDQVTREILKEHIALQDDERNADAHEKKSIGYREAAARRRVEIGRMLIEAKRGIKHGGWLPYLEKLGIEPRNAQNWMALAGHVESKNETRPDVSHLPDVGHVEDSKSQTQPSVCDLPDVPTLRDAGIDKRPRKSERADEQPDPPARHMGEFTESPEPSPAERIASRALDIDRELSAPTRVRL